MSGWSSDTALSFMKMHGAGNDFVVIDTRGGAGRVTPALARALGDRHRGVGFDQLAEVSDSDGADAGLRFFNPDGSVAGACGNATRCVAEFLMRDGRDQVRLVTERGELTARRDDGTVRVNMGQPVLDWAAVPLAKDVDTDHLPIDGDPAAVGMGNPHCVFFVEDIGAVDVSARGAAMEHHPLFPQATNVEFAQVRGPDDIRMRVWERGTGITLACGSGACATAVAARRRGLTGARVRMEMDGGVLELDVASDGVWLAGPTAHVFDGVLTADFLRGVG